MSAVQFHCPLCDGLFQVDDALAGIEVNCPHCQGLVTVPDFAGPPPLPPPPGEAMQLSCPVCTGPFQVTVELSGQDVTCPHCSQTVSVPDWHQFQPGDAAPPPLPPPVEPFLPPQLPVGRTAPIPSSPTPATKPPETPRENPASNRPLPASDPLLPPGTGSAARRTSEPADLLPPGAAGAAAGERKPLPAPIPTRSAKDTVQIPTAQGYVGVHAPVKTVVHRGQEIELRQLTPEEKARRRFVRNTILFVFCVGVLIVVTALLMWR